jgi:iron complex outermembrane receptor protein
VSAAADTDAQGDQNAEIVVTARRIEERLQEVPMSISVFSQKQLEDRNISDVTQLTTYTPSLSVQTEFGEDNSSFSIRGFQQDIGTSPTVGVYFDDVVEPRGGFSGSTIHGGEGAGPGDFFDLQNVQVLKGPQGTLFGRNTTGGAILLVPKKPSPNFEGYAEVAAGNYGMEQFQGVVNIPITDKLRIRVGVDQKMRDGYLNNISGIGPSSFQDTNYVAARVSVLADITDDIEDLLVMSFSQSDVAGVQSKLNACTPQYSSNGALFANFCVPQLQREAGSGYYDIENNNPDSHSFTQSYRFINTTTWQINDDYTLKNIASYSHHLNQTSRLCSAKTGLSRTS